MVRKFEISLSHYQKLERGVLDARLSTLKKLADAFDVTLSEFLKGVP
jgi:transcriptional regulator with XRE-family HTH domain